MNTTLSDLVQLTETYGWTLEMIEVLPQYSQWGDGSLKECYGSQVNLFLVSYADGQVRLSGFVPNGVEECKVLEAIEAQMKLLRPSMYNHYIEFKIKENI